MRKLWNVRNSILNSKDEITSWNIFHDYLVFKTDKREDELQWIYIVNFKQDFKEIKVKNPVKDPSCKIVPYLLF